MTLGGSGREHYGNTSRIQMLTTAPATTAKVREDHRVTVFAAILYPMPLANFAPKTPIAIRDTVITEECRMLEMRRDTMFLSKRNITAAGTEKMKADGICPLGVVQITWRIRVAGHSTTLWLLTTINQARLASLTATQTDEDGWINEHLIS